MTRLAALILSVMAVVVARPVTARADELKIAPQAIQFAYVSGDGQTRIDCTHAIENADAQDWRVTCAGKRYAVHLWVTAYPRASGLSKLSYEVLYWVTDWSNPRAPLQSGTTVWFHLRDPSEIQRLEVSQFVDDGSAELDLSFLPGAGDI